MIKIRYIKPEKHRGQDKAYLLDNAMNWLLFVSGGREGVSKWEEFLCWQHELEQNGYTHFIGRVWEFIMWDDTRVMPIETAHSDNIKWSEVKQ